MTELEPTRTPELTADAVVLGGGLSGLAAAIHLARGGLRVICLEPQEYFKHIVGESLDWSSPDLLANLLMPMEDLVASGAATFKRHIVLHALDGSSRQYLPDPDLNKPPVKAELRTLHLDRVRVHALLQQAAEEAGVLTIPERALHIQRDGNRVEAIVTKQGSRLRASWFIDASGAAASVFGREFNLAAVTYGPVKVAIWGHVEAPERTEGTNLYALGKAKNYMSWVWEIPIGDGVISIGYVAAGAEVKAQRASGLSNAEIFQSQMRTYDELASLTRHAVPADLSSTSFHCRTFVGACGENWMIVGEAASQSDPITGNGVTAALRHADEASALILRYGKRGSIPALARFAYNLRVLAMGRFFNSLIEKLFYQPSLRTRAGLLRCGSWYTIPAWSMNLAYSRLRPKGIVRTVALCSALAGLRLVAWSAFKLSERLKPRPAPAVRGRTRNYALQITR